MKHTRYRLFVFALLLQLFPFASKAQFYNGSQMAFGKSRVQFRNFFWYFYRYDHFNVYFYTGGKDIAGFISRTADTLIDETEKFFDFAIDDKLFFICYNNLRELQQSNIGYITDQSYNTGGITRVVGTKIFLYHDGSYTNLRTQLKLGIAETLLNQMMFGGSMKDRLKSATLLSLPEWYTKGLVSYTAHRWNVNIDNFVKDASLSGKMERFNRLSGDDAAMAGHAIWNYIAEKYGTSVIPSILYMTKLSRNVESGFLFVLGTSLKTLSLECVDYYYDRAKQDDAGKSYPEKDPLLVKSRPSTLYSNFKISPDKKYAFYTSNKMGKYKVWLFDLSTGKSKKIMKGGYKREGIIDYSYPLAAWHPSQSIISVITEARGRIYLQYLRMNNLKMSQTDTRELHHLSKVLDFSYSPDGSKLVLSGVKDAQNDIFIYGINSNMLDPITNDMYDDRYPSFAANGSEIVFSSNRTSDTLSALSFKNLSDTGTLPPLKPEFDIFSYNYSTRSAALKRLTRSSNADETYPFEYDTVHYTFISDQNGIKNRYLVRFDSVISQIDTIAHYRYVTNSFPMTNYPRSILEQFVSAKNGNASSLILSDDKFQFYSEDYFPVSEQLPPHLGGQGGQLNNTIFRNYLDRTLLREKTGSQKQKEDDQKEKKYESLDIYFMEDTNRTMELKYIPDIPKTDPSHIDIDNYIFDNETGKKEKKEKTPPPSPVAPSGDTTDPADYAHPFRSSLQWVYKPAFVTDYFVSQFDNSYLEGAYQKFTGGALYTNPGLNGLFKIGISDLLEDYRIVGGFRISGDLSNNEYVINFENLQNRLDKQFVFHRQSLLQVVELFNMVKVHTHELKSEFRWPFNEISSVKGSIVARNDRITTLSSDLTGLITPTINEYSAGLKGQFIVDNTINRGLNLYFGTRLKAFAEMYKRLDIPDAILYVIGFDVRHYQRIHRDFIWANRFAASTTFGSQKLIYYLGGVDAWIKPHFDPSTYIDPSKNYSYQALATNMRGFHQNIRNGNSFAAVNSELRMPLIRYLYPKPIRSDFLYNFQLIGFTDIGTAWTGPNPYSENNALNTKIFDKSPAFIIRLTQQRNPIVMGYGVGARSRIWGYFVRVDWARGIEEKIVLPPVWYISLSLDF